MPEQIVIERAILVGLCLADGNPDETEISLAELERLLETAGGTCFAKIVQSKDHPDARTCIGSGKVAEIRALCIAYDIELVVFDCELSPVQIKNLEDGFGENVRVIDRSMLILDIFALHAVSGEGKLQVELAQLKYTAPRLVGHGNDLSRLGGGIGTRGPGESKLESDRRHMKRRISALEAELDALERSRKTIRASRDRSGLAKVAIVGYTNAGKSTLLNRLTDAGILAEDKLFATLDPTTRKLELPDGTDVLLTDTVGFIRKLPHQLVHAFRSTLDEAVSSDVLAIVVDASDPEYRSQIETTENLLSELGAAGKPTLYIFNKCDKGTSESFSNIGVFAGNRHVVGISAVTGQGIELMLQELQTLIHDGKKTVTFKIPNADAGVLSRLYATAVVENVEYGNDFITVTATVDAKTHGMYRKYDPNWVSADE